MSQDQAASEVVAFCARRRVPFAVVPCCVYGPAFPHRRLKAPAGGGPGKAVRSYDDLVAWYQQQATNIIPVAKGSTN